MDKVLTVCLAFVFVIGVILLIYWIAGSWQAQGGGRGRLIKIIDRTMLGRDKFLVLMQLQGNTYLLGVTNETVALLDKIEGELTIETAPSVNFKTKLAQLYKESSNLKSTKESQDDAGQDE